MPLVSSVRLQWRRLGGGVRTHTSPILVNYKAKRRRLHPSLLASSFSVTARNGDGDDGTGVSSHLATPRATFCATFNEVNWLRPGRGGGHVRGRLCIVGSVPVAVILWLANGSNVTVLN